MSMFPSHQPGLSAPGSVFRAVTPSDSAALNNGAADEPCRGFYVGGAGNVSILDLANNTPTFINVPAGTTLPFRATRIRATGTTATNIIAIW